jgi:probable phosphoglycerate mutase
VDPEPGVTNNVLEYIAVGKAIQAYAATGRSGPLRIRSSSQLVVFQMTGAFKVKGGAYKPAHKVVSALVAASDFEVVWEWVPLAKNLWAADLAKEALSEAGGRPFQLPRTG